MKTCLGLNIIDNYQIIVKNLQNLRRIRHYFSKNQNWSLFLKGNRGQSSIDLDLRSISKPSIIGREAALTSVKWSGIIGQRTNTLFTPFRAEHFSKNNKLEFRKMREKREDLELVRTVVLARHGARSTLCYLEELGKRTLINLKLK